MRYAPRQANDVIACINLAPLVDVLLVLLALVIAALPAANAPVRTPFWPYACFLSGPEVRPLAPIELHVDAAGRLFWNRQPIDAAALERRLAQAASSAPGTRPLVMLSTDADTEYQAMTRVLAAVDARGLTVQSSVRTW